jgi:hypothetical protein
MSTEHWLNNADKKRNWPNPSKPYSYATLHTVNCHAIEHGHPLMTNWSLTTRATTWPNTMGIVLVCMDYLL